MGRVGWCVGVFAVFSMGCFGMFPFFPMSALSEDNQNQMDDQTQKVVYYTRLQPPVFDSSPTPPPKDSALSSQNIHGTPINNSIEIRRSDLLAEVQNSKKQEAKKPPLSKQSFHAVLNNCAKDALFNELGAGLSIDPQQKAKCKTLQAHYNNTLNKHYAPLQKSYTTLLQDMVGACHTHADRMALLQSAFFKRLSPHIKNRQQRALLSALKQNKPLSREKLHALLQQPNLGERFYRCQYFIHAP
ncbi:hypothetical protein [Helicobacter felis]|uniref:hypothetical protein n=1 Tax=Helicobacter felis TaxID=214 RepID=UPI000CEE3483|nr:hypothetical protein [Helicobacter felis]